MGTIEFATAEEYVAYRVFVQTVDEDGAFTYELVDRFRDVPNKIVESFTDRLTADTRCALLRAARVREVSV